VYLNTRPGWGNWGRVFKYTSPIVEILFNFKKIIYVYVGARELSRAH
jgi:hypothetical protein